MASKALPRKLTPGEINVLNRLFYLEDVTVEPTSDEQVIRPSDGVLGLSSVTVMPGGAGGMTELELPVTIEPEEPYTGFSRVVVGALLQQEKTVSPAQRTIEVVPDDLNGFFGLSKVTVEAAMLQDKSVTPTTAQQTVSADEGYYGLGNVTVEATPLENVEITPSQEVTVVAPTSPNIGLSSVTINIIAYHDVENENITVFADLVDTPQSVYDISEAIHDILYNE